MLASEDPTDCPKDDLTKGWEHRNVSLAKVLKVRLALADCDYIP